MKYFSYKSNSNQISFIIINLAFIFLTTLILSINKHLSFLNPITLHSKFINLKNPKPRKQFHSIVLLFHVFFLIKFKPSTIFKLYTFFNHLTTTNYFVMALAFIYHIKKIQRLILLVIHLVKLYVNNFTFLVQIIYD